MRVAIRIGEPGSASVEMIKSILASEAGLPSRLCFAANERAAKRRIQARL